MKLEESPIAGEEDIRQCVTMVSLDHVAHRIISYIPYVLVLIDLRYEGKEPSASNFFTRKAA